MRSTLLAALLLTLGLSLMSCTEAMGNDDPDTGAVTDGGDDLDGGEMMADAGEMTMRDGGGMDDAGGADSGGVDSGPEECIPATFGSAFFDRDSEGRVYCFQ